MGAAEAHIDFMRLRQLRRTEILDSGADLEFDRLARLTAQLCETVGAAIVFFDTDRVWCKASHGPFDARHLHPKFVEALLAQDRFLVIADVADYFASEKIDSDKSLTQPASFMAVPLSAGDGFVVGALCVFNERPGALSIEKAQVLEGFAREIDSMVAAFASSVRPQQLQLAMAAFDRVGESAIIASHGGEIRYANATAKTFFDLNGKSLAARSFIHLAKSLEARYSLSEGKLTTQLLPLLLQASPDERRVLKIDAVHELIIERVALPDFDSVAVYFREIKLNGFVPLGQMAGSLIHELNGSLAVVVGLARQIAGGEVVDDARREADQRLLRASSLVSQLMLSVRELFTESHPKNVKVELGECIKQAVDLRSEAITRERVQLDWQISSAAVMGRPVQLMQVFSSLLKDSIVALRGADEKKIRLEMKSEAGFVVLSYWDSRTDLTADKRAKLFDFFRQENPGHSESSLAMGLVEKMILKHGGEVFLASENSGLGLTIRLPEISLT